MAKMHFLRAVELYPAYANAWNNLGGIYQMYFNQQDSALHAFAMASSIDLNDPKPVYNSGLIYQGLKDSLKAEEFFRKTLDIDSEYIPALTSLADQLFMQLRFSDAIPFYLRAERIKPGQFAVCNNLGSSYVMIGDTLNALKYFEQALAMNSSNKALCGVISDYYRRHGNPEKADYYGKLAKKN
jgi:tetratricopeptide (TPR) repeat protein